MGKKMLVALMMEGKFSGEGLQSLDTDEDLMSAMVRELVEKAGVGETADAAWRELERERERVFAKLPQIDCGCCGAPTCMAFSEDFVRGLAKLSDCIFFHT